MFQSWFALFSHTDADPLGLVSSRYHLAMARAACSDVSCPHRFNDIRLLTVRDKLSCSLALAAASLRFTTLLFGENPFEHVSGLFSELVL